MGWRDAERDGNAVTTFAHIPYVPTLRWDGFGGEVIDGESGDRTTAATEAPYAQARVDGARQLAIRPYFTARTARRRGRMEEYNGLAGRKRR